MVFSSHIFLFYFLPLVLALYYLVPRTGKELVLVSLSYLFYAWANPLFVFLMLGTTLVNYICGRCMENATPRGRKVSLVLSIAASLFALGFFKYFNFGVDSFNATVQALGLENLQLELLIRVILPLGLSFYTFQAISYAVDVYRGEARPVHSFLRFATYISLFPQLVAGPIVRFREIASQLEQRTHSWEKFARGVCFFVLGFSKKVLIANPCGRMADTAFAAPVVSTVDAWIGILGYSFQIYFDFSGYSDMAIGLGLMFGFVFPKNFDSPYRASSITEFWRRWHLSLSRWLRDYLYIPLGGNQKGSGRTYTNLGTVMLLGGLWHGASWNFVLWGGGHGALLMLERFFGKRIKKEEKGKVRILGNAVGIAWTFLLVTLLWVFFRADTLGASLQYYQSLFGMGASDERLFLVTGMLWQPYLFFTLVVAALVTWTFPQTWNFTRKLRVVRVVWIFLLFFLSIVALETQSFNPFIYFIF